MFLKTLRSRILIVVTGIVFFTTIMILILVQGETGEAIYTAHNENAQNLINTVLLSVENQHKSILFYQSALLERRKTELKNITSVALSLVSLYHKQYKTGLLSEDEAKKQALLELKNARYDDGVGYFWVNDTTYPLPYMIMHPTIPELDSKLLDDPKYNCAMGINKNLFTAFVDVCRAHGEGYVDYLWPKPTKDDLTEEQPKISYVTLFEPWQWVIGTGVYVDDIENDVQKRVEAVIQELRDTFSKVNIAKSGYMFLFNSNKEMLIHPSLVGIDGNTLIEPVTGKNLFDEMMAAAKTPDKILDYVWDKPQHEGELRFRKRAYINYYEPLDWYFGASVYYEEIERPAKTLSKQIFCLFGIFLLAAFVVSILLAKNLTEPLRKLALTVGEIEEKGMASVDIPIYGTEETKKLGTILNTMISSVHQSEKELIKSEERLSNIINSMPSVLVGVNAEGKVTQWNHRAEQETGVAEENARGEPLETVFPRLAQKMDKINNAIQEREIQKETKINFHDNGETRYENMTIYPLSSQEAEGVVVRLDDVSEMVKLEEMMIQTEKMLSVGGLAAGMAHEINNPLASIMQNITVTLNRLTRKMSKNDEAAEACGTDMDTINRFMEQRNILDLLKMVHESGSRAAKIVQNMLSFARKGDMQAKPHDLCELIDETIELARNDYDLKKKYDFRRIQIIREYSPDAPKVLCEASKIQQVILNILKNGAEALYDGQTENPTFQVRVYPDHEKVQIEVEDNGPGMDESTRKQIFEPFFTTKGVGVGTGLGLSVSYFIITENHGGVMNVESAPARGTKFILSLPLTSKSFTDSCQNVIL